ncbi:hypothetical protein L249_7293 [Ophiocordyceps polyrhachis-furcata BCC 54312]|uniref:Mediator of RNA polymerase II transcription subunit 14 n=1 Tax=Ophiocordyceps polyrhachis-furcata BCC 54312 TaxID=1330021 RepID=A0A367LAP7_9HYPO|nr:hypothetical protein L249_7293 [Ophiocordyceps polyrhachis-furcata BCC 54312]
MALASKNGDGAAESSLARPRSRMNDLPDEIIHITQGFIPLSLLLTRLAQTTHNSLQDKISELAKMPLPATAVNGNASSNAALALDDTSSENLRKKGSLASFAQDLHGKWLKALVITEWSRKSEMVSKLIDLKFHIDQQRILYDACLDNIVNVKRDLTFARMPSPDLKTALQVLSAGRAPWMPDLNYIEPPPLTPREQLKWIDDLNTLLSLRLNLDDYDKIPYHFKNYDIASGRVTFKVDGEFQVDLTIADEDFEKQFWFIDFRYDFSPAPSSLSASLRAYLEGCVNEALSKDGLAGCYRFLHEFVMTFKINELKRQAFQLNRSSWTGTLSVEQLNRSLAIQYWPSRALTTGFKSWILLAVNSGRRADGRVDEKATSFIVAKWYRDGKEVKDVDIELDLETLSAEGLLTAVIGRHIEYILTGVHDKLLTTTRFRDRDASMVLDVSRSDPAMSSLSIQVSHRGEITLLMEPMTGSFSLKPPSKFTVQHEHQLNNARNTAEDGAACLETVRCLIMEDEINRRGSLMGWTARKPPLTVEEAKSATRLRGWTRALWMQKDGWGANWFIAVFLGLGSDEWWLLEVPVDAPAAKPTSDGFNRGRHDSGRSVKSKSKLLLPKSPIDLSEEFWINLTMFTTGVMVQSMDFRELHRHKIKCRSSNSMDLSLPEPVRIPSIQMSLSVVFPSMVSSDKPEDGRKGDLSADKIELFSLMQKYTGAVLTLKRAWAEDSLVLNFSGLQCMPTGGGEPTSQLVCLSDAVIRVRKPSRFAALKGMVDRGVTYNPRRGEFSLQIRRRLGEPMLDTLKSRIKAVDRFVNLFEALANAGGNVTTETMTLERVTFCYGNDPDDKGEVATKKKNKEKIWRLSLDLSGDEIEVEVEDGNPHLRTMDLMRRLVNSDGGIGALTAWLPASLPALQAVSEMNRKWAEVEAGNLEFTMKAIGWMSIAYKVGTGRWVKLEVRIKRRRDEAWWHLCQSSDAAVEDDKYSKALKVVWTGHGDGWLGLGTGAVGRPSGGVGSMLLAAHEAIRSVESHDVVVLD